MSSSSSSSSDTQDSSSPLPLQSPYSSDSVTGPINPQTAIEANLDQETQTPETQNSSEATPEKESSDSQARLKSLLLDIFGSSPSSSSHQTKTHQTQLEQSSDYVSSPKDKTSIEANPGQEETHTQISSEATPDQECSKGKSPEKESSEDIDICGSSPSSSHQIKTHQTLEQSSDSVSSPKDKTPIEATPDQEGENPSEKTPNQETQAPERERKRKETCETTQNQESPIETKPDQETNFKRQKSSEAIPDQKISKGKSPEKESSGEDWDPFTIRILFPDTSNSNEEDDDIRLLRYIQDFKKEEDHPLPISVKLTEPTKHDVLNLLCYIQKKMSQNPVCTARELRNKIVRMQEVYLILREEKGESPTDENFSTPNGKLHFDLLKECLQ